MIYIYAIICVIGIAIGQILFKLSSISLASTGSLFTPKVLLPLSVAVFLYGLTTVGWVWILKYIELGKIYPIMALSFAIVPIGAYFIFNERFNLQYGIGILLIISGIILSTNR
ncbi:EamA family transporter [Atlantibacter sp.]|uniref:EamA family transporter n=1 Tax=Atlantibacter sp. TaxID=1903473 RepID=UPI0028B00AF9|nr:EamA family transporter [Atlantibacter sp.]